MVKRFLDAGLYGSIDIRPEEIEGLLLGIGKIEGYCSYCEKNDRPFHYDEAIPLSWFYDASRFYHQSGSDYSTYARLRNVYSKTFVCQFNEQHIVTVILRRDKNNLQKIGQYPSHHDMAGNLKLYEKELGNNLLSKAEGLFSHGLGIGAFVYLRRVLEQLIVEAYKEQNGKEPDKDFNARPFSQRVKELEHLFEDFSASVKGTLYSLLSEGVHSLDEDTCKKQYPLLKEVIIQILDERKEKKSKEQRRARLQIELDKANQAVRSSK